MNVEGLDSHYVNTVTVNNAVDTLVGSEPLIYARACSIKCTGSNMKPATTVNVFVNGILVNSYVQGKNWSPGATAPLPLGSKFRTDGSGNVSFILNLPGGTFKTGDITITVTDGTTVDNGTTTLSSIFHSSGTLQVYQRTNSQLAITQISQPWDPVAQSFFTFGTNSPISVTSIDLFFATKDQTIPLQLQIRKMVAGYPDVNYVSADAVVDMPAANVNVTGDADNFSTPTNFKFKTPIVLDPDQQYCFVIQSNSNAYYLYMASTGQQSFETKKVIFEQPYTGVMFKSQNNFTWTTVDNSALKFNINKAVYDTGTVGKFFLGGNTSSRMVPGAQFSTTVGTNKILFRSFEQHGYTGASGETITITPNLPMLAGNPSMGSYGNFNGFTVANLSGNLQINRIIDNYTIEIISAGGSATSTGPITTSGMINFISISNLDPASPYPTSIQFPVPIGTGTRPATAINYALPANTPAGVPFTGITLSDPGLGYTTDFTLPINGSNPTTGWVNGITGSGVTVNCSCTAYFVVDMVKPISLFTTNLGRIFPSGSNTSIKHTFTNADHTLSPQYTTDLTGPNYVPIGAPDAILCNNATSSALNQPLQSINIEVDMSTTNPNVGPLFNFTSGASLSTYAYVINDQGFSESTSATVSSSGVNSITVTSGGSGYTVTPNVVVVPAEDETNLINIVAATATTTMASGVVTGITVTSAGSGYTRPPNIVVDSPGSSGSIATGYTSISPINSELLPLNGNALGRYITKEIKLAMPSTGVRIRSNIISTPITSVDFYIKTSMGGATQDILDSQPWQILTCATPRNKSIKSTDVFEYEFSLDGMTEFTSYKLKAVLSSQDRNSTPYIKDYKVIVTA